MVSDTDSTPISNSQFSSLRNRLLISYLAVIATILGIFSGAIYLLVAHDRHQQLNAHLRQVAESSAATLEIIQHEYEELTTEEEYQGYVPRETDGTPVPITLVQLMGKYTGKSVSEIVSSPLKSDRQGIEWYDQQQELIVYEGGLILPTSLPDNIPREGILAQQGKIRSRIEPVYIPSATNPDEILGYVRVNESTFALEAELRRLRWGLILGVLTVSGLAAGSGIWLTSQSLKPIVQNFEQLKQFTSDASHELRNPLTAIRASIGVMQSHPERVHPADVKKLRAIAIASAQMSQLVDDLLLLARMDRIAPDRRAWRRIPLDEMLEDLVDLYGDRAEEAGIGLKSELAPHIEVCGDVSQLQRLFANLLANALHYTPPDGTVIVSLERTRSYALVTVQDTGIGIAPEQLPYIFDRFWRADQARSQDEQGSGLGLAIAKTIAQRHGGKIIVSSQPQIGSRFQVYLPPA